MQMTKELRMKIAAGLGIVLLFVIACYAARMDSAPKDVSADAVGGEYLSPTEAEGSAIPSDDETMPPPRQATISVMDGPNRVGAVTLTDLGKNRTRIVVTLSNPDRDKALPTAIYGGSCTEFSREVQYPLNPTTKGRSDTTLTVNIGALLDKAPQSIRIKTDAVDAAAPYAGCANLN
jgi:hypothetical protein